jgi:AcrR family transcriptional regulator
MARPKNSPEKIERMRNAMMDAVVELLDEVPPDKVSIRMIADKIGVSHMVFYTYFEDRAEIIQALVKRQQERIDCQFQGLIEKAEKESVTEVLKVVLRDYVQKAHDHPKIFRLFWMPPKSGGEEGETLKHFMATIENLQELISLGIEKGEFSQRNSYLASVTLLSLINAPLIMHECGKMPPRVTCDQLLDEVVVALFAYLKN